MAIKANIVIDQGADFSADIAVADTSGSVFNLTGYNIAAQMRKNYTSNTAVTFTTTSNGSGGSIFLSLNNATTATIEPGRYMYDVEITSPAGIVTRVVEGIATVTPGITRV